jgi:predicted nucleic acid-binding protein
VVIFIDTSTLVRLYIKQEGSDNIHYFFSENNIDNIFISELTKIEFLSAIYKNYRSNKIGIDEAERAIENFIIDLLNIKSVVLNSSLIKIATELIKRYKYLGLRTLDSIQLASAINVKNEIEEVLCTDNKLNEIFLLENFNLKVF